MTTYQKFMSIALDEARESYNRGDFPVGAVLISEGKIIGKGNNSGMSNKEWSSHAEASIIKAHAPAIQRIKKEGKLITLFTTLKPCLMCLGTIVLNRVGKIIYACPDPNGGATKLDPTKVPDWEWYAKKWPTIENGVLRNESYELLIDYMKQYDSWKNVLQKFEAMHSKW